MALHNIEEAHQHGARLRCACEIVGIDERSYRRWRKLMREQKTLEDQRAHAAQLRVCEHALSMQEKETIYEVCNRSEYASLPPSQIVPRLADQGIYLASESSMYRVLKEFDANHPRGKSKPREVQTLPREWVATAPNQVWTWDITYLPTTIKGQFLYLSMLTDIFTRAIVGWEVHETESAHYASLLMRKACLRHNVRSETLVLHSDNGDPMKGATMLATLQALGVIPSFSRPSVSNDNPYSESLFKTLKYCPAYPRKPFTDIDDARQWVHSFTHWYNHEHKHSGIRFVSPMQRHRSEDKDILEQRDRIYQEAKEQNPLRWRGRNTRNWSYIEEVTLNPGKYPKTQEEKIQQFA